jgi:translation initiation factor 3 subunit I
MGHLGSIVVLNIDPDVNAEQSDERELTIVCDESKATVAGWSYLAKYILAGHEDGSVSKYDAKVCCQFYIPCPYEFKQKMLTKPR